MVVEVTNIHDTRRVVLADRRKRVVVVVEVTKKFETRAGTWQQGEDNISIKLSIIHAQR